MNFTQSRNNLQKHANVWQPCIGAGEKQALYSDDERIFTSQILIRQTIFYKEMIDSIADDFCSYRLPTD